MTDYEGLGTAGIHTYMDRVSQGRAVLDVVRAAQRIPGTGLSPTSPVGIEGYSQGGGAAAAAAELAATYAPELLVKGVAVGAVPADLAKVATTLDGGLYSAFAFFALRGISASYGVDLSPYLNAKGIETMTTVEQDCVFDLFGHAFVKSSTLSHNGKPMSDLIALPQFAAMIADQRIGTIKPAMPVYVGHSAFDDVIPYAVGKAMARSWCGKGANVRILHHADPDSRRRLRAVRRGGVAVLRGPVRRAAPAEQLLADLSDGPGRHAVHATLSITWSAHGLMPASSRRRAISSTRSCVRRSRSARRRASSASCGWEVGFSFMSRA